MKNSFLKQIVALIGILMLFFVLLFIAMVIFQLKGMDEWRMMMAVSALQNIGLFIIPAVIVAYIFNRGKTMQVLQINRLPSLKHLGLMVLIYIAAIPMLDAIIVWNESWQLPEWLMWMREQEDAALSATDQMMAVSSVAQLVGLIFVVGVLTGIGEEFLFRGSLQRLMVESKVNVHVAVWATAFIFSVIHMQIFGFVPRLLLGAFFGYMLAWSGSLWLPILAHALNNSMAVIASQSPAWMNNVWFEGYTSPLLVGVSGVVTAALIYLFYRLRVKQ